MVDAQLIKWVKDQMARGVTEERLRDYMLQTGYDADTVDGAFNPPKPKSFLVPILAGVILLLAVGGFFMFTDKPELEEVVEDVAVKRTHVLTSNSDFKSMAVTQQAPRTLYEISDELRVLTPDTISKANVALESINKKSDANVVILTSSRADDGSSLYEGYKELEALEYSYDEEKKYSYIFFLINRVGNQDRCSLLSYSKDKRDAMKYIDFHPSCKQGNFNQSMMLDTLLELDKLGDKLKTD